MNIRSLALAKGNVILLYKVRNSDQYFNGDDKYELPELLTRDQLDELSHVATTIVVSGTKEKINKTLKQLREH